MIGHEVARAVGGSRAKAAALVKADVLNVVALTDYMVTPGPAIAFAELLGAGSLALEGDCGQLLLRLRRGPGPPGVLER